MTYSITIEQFIIVFVFLVAIMRQILYWTWLWQLKEYRTDRLRAHFQDIGPKSAFLTLIGCYSLKQNKIPKFTVKAIMVGIFSFLIGIIALILLVKVYLPQIFMAFYAFNQFSFVSYKIPDNPINLEVLRILFDNILQSLNDYEIIIELMAAIFIVMPPVIFLFIFFLNIISGFFKKRIVRKAKEKLIQFPNLKVVGITGSYGKSITKEILADILSKKYKVLKTPENINTAIGIAQLILDKLNDNHEIFVVEMGAYKIGEIKEICDMVQPRIGIITAINEQHLALFGKIENTIKAKFELIDSLPSDGLAILNAGDENVQNGAELWNLSAKGIKTEVKLYSVGAKSDVYAISEATDRQSIKFKFISGAIIKEFIVNITGAHNISNILAAIIAAEEFGMDLDKISQILQKANYSDAMLRNLAGPSGSVLIDDTYNSNPSGVFAALNHIKNQRGRKIVVMSPLIELGSSAYKIHQKIGKEISNIAAKVFFLDNYYAYDIKKGASENKNSNMEIKKEKNIKKIAEYLRNKLNSTDTVLFINRGARKVLEELKK